jgi:TonB family protein
MSGLKLLSLFTLATFVTSCSAFRGFQSDHIVPPTLLEKTQLPPPPTTVDAKNFYLKMELTINKEGKVLRVDLQNSSGDKHWDSLAVLSIMQWKYSPATSNGKPIQLKIVQTAKVVVTPPEMMDLYEIVCATLAEADSIYSALEKGASFDSLAKAYSISSTAPKGGYLGNVDIHNFQDEIQSALKELEPGRFTHPMPFGRNYIIYRRAPIDNSAM